jgi:hypothetical protein
MARVIQSLLIPLKENPDIVHILEQANDLIQESIEVRELVAAGEPGQKLHKIKCLDVNLINEATKKSKRRDKQPRERRG